MDPIEYDREGQERREVCHCIRHRGSAGKDIADVVAQQQHRDREQQRDDERAQVHDHHRESRRLRVPGPELVAHSHTASFDQHGHPNSVY